MIRAANYSSYPRVADSPLDQQVRSILKAAERGRATAEEVTAVADEVTTVLVADQSRAFIDIVTDGMVRWAGPLSHLAQHLDGLELRELRRWFETNFYDRRVAVVGEIRRRVEPKMRRLPHGRRLGRPGDGRQHPAEEHGDHRESHGGNSQPPRRAAPSFLIGPP